MQSIRSIIQLVIYLSKKVVQLVSILGVLLVVAITSPLIVQAQTDSGDSNRVLSNIFPACKFADTGVASFLECGSQVTFFILVIAIIYAFLKLAYTAINGLLFAGGVTSDFYQMIGDSLRNLVVGILFVGMPVTILTVIDPLAGILNFRFLEEFNLGPEARLIDVTLKSRNSCNHFIYCINNCKESTAIDKTACVEACKKEFSNCKDCFKFISNEGEILDKKGFENCIAPGTVTAPKGDSLGDKGSILSCGNNQPITDSNGFVRLAYTPYISQNMQPDGNLTPAPIKYRNNGCGGASALMIVEMSRPGTFPCLDSQKLANFSGDQDNYCLYTYFWQNDNYQYVFMNPEARMNLINNTDLSPNSSCQGAFGITSQKKCDQSYNAGRKRFLEYFRLTTESVDRSQYFQAIKDNINQGLPLFISINFTANWSHIMVIVGYNEQTKQILLNDPWQYDTKWGSSRLMVVTLNQGNTRISGYKYNAYPTPSIGYIEKVRKMSGFDPVQCNLV